MAVPTMNYKQELTMIQKFTFLTLICLFSTAFAQEAKYKESDAVKICGTIVKKKTRYDGIQSIFTKTDDEGKVLKRYSLQGVKEQAVHVLGSLVQDVPVDACITGVPYGGVMFDSEAPFYTLKIEPK